MTENMQTMYSDGRSSLLLRSVEASWNVKKLYDVSITPGRPYIIMLNHRSRSKIPLIYVSLPGSIRMLTKKELFKIPLWGRGMKAAEFISIDRKDHEQALKDLDEARR